MKLSEACAFLVVHGSATLRFDMPEDEAQSVAAELDRHAASLPADQARAAAREYLRTGFLDDAHLDPVRSQPLARTAVWLSLRSASAKADPSLRGHVIRVSTKPDGSFNFRFEATEPAAVDIVTEQAREGLNYVVAVSKEQARKAAMRKRTPPGRDPSLEPHPRPRPERCMAALEQDAEAVSKAASAEIKDCLEAGALFVWRSRQLADTAKEEISASLSAMAEHDKLHLPFPRIFAETRDWIDVPVHDGPANRVKATLCVTAAEDDLNGTIRFRAFSDIGNGPVMSLVGGVIDRDSLSSSPGIELELPAGAARQVGWDEALHRRITRTCGDRLLELLFLLATQGVQRDKVQVGSQAKHARRPAGQRRVSPRSYAVIRVPLRFEQGSTGSGETGRWVRPHARRAHMWGKNVRPPEEQQWRPSCLVNAAEMAEGEAVRRPEYRVA